MDNLSSSPHGDTLDPELVTNQKEQQYDNYAKKKSFRRKKDRGYESTSGPGLALLFLINNFTLTGDTQIDELRPNGEEQQVVPDERKVTTSHIHQSQNFQNGKHHYANENFNGSKGGRGRDLRTSKTTGKGLNSASQAKPEHKFNLDSDFPSLV